MRLERWNRNNCTLGILSCGTFQCFTLELPDLDNQPDISCIPTGKYDYYFRDSPKNGPVLELRAVPNRTYIQIHAGNFTSDIHGCILVGDSIKFLNNDEIPDIANSRNTHNRLLELAGKSGSIEIV